ncbi:glycosyltransferase family 25 protein [Psychrobacter sp. ANT_H59]|uniref:glycosyltransferase family 25 protein n=1 Tax=Psychrobacter sp. ANT_H59 TaxID=2597354 RepID=UPI0011EF66DD|nr:glycosyltransferase family 25 protein [Psychrobacter sp. ANT_H59]KAA0939606.1 glycosyltransferase family 25 protein [Psychrobacter sp. ANT_H59]
MQNHIISLTTATDRRQHIIQEFTKQNIPSEFYDAITASQLTEVSKALGLRLAESERLSPIEKACFLIHVCLWQKNNRRQSRIYVNI